jgi:hypothetical protein
VGSFVKYDGHGAELVYAGELSTLHDIRLISCEYSDSLSAMVGLSLLRVVLSFFSVDLRCLFCR